MKHIVRCVCFIIAAALFLAGCSKTPEDIGLEAREKLSSGRLEEARIIIAKAYREDSTGTVDLYGKGLIQEYNGLDWDALMSYLEAAPGRDGYRPAMDDFSRLSLDMNYGKNGLQMARVYINKFPNSPEGYLFVSDFLARNQMIDSAEYYLGLAREKGVDEPDFTLRKARQIVLTGTDKDITRTMDTLSQTRIRSAEHFGRMAEIYHSLYIGDSAIYYAQKAVDSDSKNMEYRLRLARYLFDDRRLYDAKREITHILNTAESFGKAYLLAAYIERALGNGAGAIIMSDSFIIGGNDSPIALEKYGDFLNYVDAPRESGSQYQAAYTLAVNKQYPDDVITHLFIKVMNAALDAKDISLAVAFFREAEERYPELPEMNFFKAELMLRFKDAQDSSKILIDDNLTKNFSNRSWLDKASKYFYRGNRFELAAQSYRRLLQLPQPKLEYVQNLLMIYHGQNNVFATDSLVTDLSERFKNNLQVMEALRDIYQNAGEIDRALEYGRALYRRSDQYLPYIDGLAGLHVASGHIDSAREVYRTYCASFPENADGRYRLARFELEHGGENVRTAISQALELDSMYAPALELKGRYFEQENQRDSALALYRKVVDMRSPTPFAYYNLARHFIETGDSLLRAEGLARSAQVYFGTDPRGYLVLGDVYMAQQKYKLARTQYASGLTLSPDSPTLTFMLGKSQYLLKEYKDAKTNLKAALDLNLASPMKEEAERMLSRL